jgi:hypothetical protein
MIAELIGTDAAGRSTAGAADQKRVSAVDWKVDGRPK